MGHSYMIKNGQLNRRSVMTFGLGLLAIKLPLSSISEKQSELAVVEVTIDFPEDYTMENYEFDVPKWTNNEKVRDYIRSFVSRGQLTEYTKTGHDHGVKYRFVFKSPGDLKSFVVGVREQQLVNFESRANRGLVTKMHVSGTEIKC